MARVIDLFCGCGGFSLGFLQAGFHVKYAIDNWKGCKETFEFNHPKTEFILSDIQKLNPENFRDVDIVIGSPPCQEFSKANNHPDIKKGMILIKEYLKWIDVIKPKYWIMENVPGIQKYLEKSDFKINILNCANYGVPQKRIRCFSGNYFVPNPTHSKKPTQDLFGNRLGKWITVREALKNKDDNNLELGFIPYSDKWLKKHPPIEEEKVSITITSKNDKNYFRYWDSPNYQNGFKSISTKMKSNNKVKDNEIYRRLSVRECAILQSFPENFIFFGSLSNQYTMVGNAVPPLMAYHLAKEIKKRFN